MAATYIDVTELLASGLQTGIQRVVRRIARSGAALGTASLTPVIARGDQFYKLNGDGLTALYGATPPAAQARLTSGGPAMRLAKRVLGIVPPLYDRVQIGHFRRKLAAQLTGKYELSPVEYGYGDRLVLLDSFWGGSTALRAARRARNRGCRIIAVVYDMIPATHARFADARLARAFPGAILGAASICTGFVTISRYCQQVIQDYLEQNVFALPVSYFYLGADLLQHADQPAPDSELLPLDLGNSPGRLHLMVGTIEPRKGHAVVLDAFDLLWRQQRPDNLIVVGKVGWDVDVVMTRFRSHPELGRRLFLIHDASDATLDSLFARANAAIMASTVEGFGLPLVEALYRKVPVIASDIPVFREIAGDAALYFKLDDAADLARAVIEVEQHSSELRAAAAKFQWIDWAQSFAQFRIAVDEVAPPMPDVRAAESGLKLDVHGDSSTGAG